MSPRAREGHGATIDVPPTVPLEHVRRTWDDVPELACVDAWQHACRKWWADPEDRRLRATVRDALWLDDEELAEWLQRRFDPTTLIRAHGHVTAMRAGVERDLATRTLETGSLRTVPVWTDHRDGTRRRFVAADQVPGLLTRAARDFQQVPEHPFIRAAWLSQTLGVVHPFRDANGGTARFYSSLELARCALPPLVLSIELRNGPYIEALAIRTSLDPLTLVVYEAVQQRLAHALLAPGGQPATERDETRAALWTTAADESIRAAVGELDVQRAPADASAMARITRAGTRLPTEPAPMLTSWRVATPVPAHIDLVVSALRGGATTWTVAAIIGRAGERGELGTAIERQHVANYFVAASGEADAIVQSRLRRWLDGRFDQIVRGLARWM